MLLEIWENCRQKSHIERRQLQAFVEMLAAAFSFWSFMMCKIKIKFVSLHPSWDYRHEKGTWNGKQVSSAGSWGRFDGDEQHGCLLCTGHRCCGGSCHGIYLNMPNNGAETMVTVYINNVVKQMKTDLRLIEEQQPLIHNITNYVAINFVANSLLAIGASPIMDVPKKKWRKSVARVMPWH